jgi:hypothetical protein
MLQHKLVLLHLYNINCFFVWIAFLLLPAMEMSPATSPFFVSKVAPKRSGTVKLVYHERSRAEYYPQNHLGTPCKRLRPVYGVGQKNVCFMPPLRYHKHFNSQLRYLLCNNYIERIARGVYQITPRGRQYPHLLKPDHASMNLVNFS